MSKNKKSRRRPRPVAFTLWSRLAVTGQKLRADEAVSHTTFGLALAAKRIGRRHQEVR